MKERPTGTRSHSVRTIGDSRRPLRALRRFKAEVSGSEG